MSRQEVFPRTELIVGGRALVALESSNTHGYRNPSAGMSARVRPADGGFDGTEAIAVRRGYRSAASLRQRFGGTLNANSLRWAPQAVAFTGNGPLVRTQTPTGIEDTDLVPHGPDDPPTDERYAAAWIDATDGTIVAGLLALCGCPVGAIADTGTLFATLAPGVQSRYAVRLASDQAPWQLIEEIDRITGCKTFDGPDGRVTRIVASGLPSGTAARTYTQGADFKGEDAGREFSSEGVVNKVTVTGQSGILADGTPYSIAASRTKASPYVPTPPGTREYTFQSDLIETEELAGQVAARLLAELGRRKEYVTLPLAKGDPGVYVGMTVAVVSDALALTAATPLRVVEVQDRHDGSRGYQTTLVLEGGAAAEGTDPNQAPVPAIAVEIELETDANGDPIAVARFDSSGSMDPDGAIALREWDGDPVVPTPIGDGTVAVATYSPLPTSPAPTVTLTVQDDLGKRASLTVEVVATGGNSYTRELWLACGASLDYTADQAAWVTHAVPAAVIAEQAGDAYQLAAGDDGVARRVLAVGTATVLGDLAGVSAFFVSRDRNGAETGVAWAAASDGRVWRSVDQGASWGAVAPLPNGGRCNAIEESPYAPGDLYAGGGNVLYHSYDAGASWQAFYTHPNAAYVLTRLASGIAAGATDDPGDDTPVMWLGFSGPSGATEARVVERAGALTHTLPSGAATPLDVSGLTISLDAERLIVADPGGDGGRIWTAPTLAGGDLTARSAYDAVKVEYGAPKHVIRDGRFPIAWGVSVDMAWKTTDEGGSFHPVRAITGAGRAGRMVGYGRLRQPLPVVAVAHLTALAVPAGGPHAGTVRLVRATGGSPAWVDLGPVPLTGPLQTLNKTRLVKAGDGHYFAWSAYRVSGGAGGRLGELWETTDDGATWTNIPEGNHIIAFALLDDGTYYLAVATDGGTGLYGRGPTQIVYHDGSGFHNRATYTTDQPAGNTVATGIAADPTNALSVAYQVHNGAMLSTDGGATFPTNVIGNGTVSSNTPENLIEGVPGRVIKVPYNGAINTAAIDYSPWPSGPMTVTPTTLVSQNLPFVRAASGNLYIVGTFKVVQSTDNGDTWNDLPIPTTTPLGVTELATTGGGSFGLAAQYNGDGTVPNPWREAWYSSNDGGATWADATAQQVADLGTLYVPVRGGVAG